LSKKQGSDSSWSNKIESSIDLEFLPDIYSAIELENGDMASAHSQGDIKIWNVKNSQLIKTIHHVYPPNARFRMALLADGNVTFGDERGVIQIWDLVKEVQVKSLYGLVMGTIPKVSIYREKNIAIFDTDI
jgi:hypothetical protein